VHARDVMVKLVTDGTDTKAAFNWISQMRYVGSQKSLINSIKTDTAIVKHSLKPNPNNFIDFLTH
jgi:hypothetical protein